MKRIPPPLGVTMVHFLTTALSPSTIVGAMVSGVMALVVASVTPFPGLVDVGLIGVGAVGGAILATPIRGVSIWDWFVMYVRTILTKPVVRTTSWDTSQSSMQPLQVVQNLIRRKKTV